MITEREIAEYQTLRATLISLHEKFLKRKSELRRLLEETAVLRRNAFLTLEKANRLTRHLTGRQRQITGLSYRLNEIKARINRINQNYPVLFEEIPPDVREECRDRRELKQKELLFIGLIDRIRKNLLQLDLLELRCQELILSINKALEAFRHESRIIRRKIYPFGFVSLLYRSLRFLWGKSYFSTGDMEDVAALGAITGHVLKIADSPVI